MFCPRCGRQVNATANFCGGCGLPRAEIERLLQNTAPVSQPETNTVDINDINNTISQLENDLTGINSVENYTTDSTINTNKVENDFTFEDITLNTEEKAVENTIPELTTEYRYVPPEYPDFTAKNTQQYTTQETVESQPELTTVDFIWMMLISGIPVIGFIYLLYTAFLQKDNATKSNWAKATLILFAFAFVLSLVFSLGIMMTSFMFW